MPEAFSQRHLVAKRSFRKAFRRSILPEAASRRTMFFGSNSPGETRLNKLWLLYFPQHCLNFLPLPQGHGSLRPTFGPVRIGLALATASMASFTTSEPLPPPLLADAVASLSPAGVLCWVCLGRLRRKFSKAIMLDALRKMLWHTSVLMFTISVSNIW